MATEFEETQYNPNSLIIRGRGADPSIPEGFISVNGQLQRSQAAPQPLPSWIVEADQEAEERRRRDELQAQLNAQQNQPSAQAARGIERAMQLEGVLGFDADRKRGIPVQEALMKWAPKMYFRNPAQVARLMRPPPQQPQPFAPTEVQTGSQRLVQVSPNRFQVIRPERVPQPQQLSPGGKLQVLKTQLSELDKQMLATEGDIAATQALQEQRKLISDAIGEMSPAKKAATPANPVASPKTPDKSEARKEAEALIKSRPRIADQVRARFKQTYGEDL